MKWILIMMVLSSSPQGGAAISAVEFNSEIACNEARQMVVDTSSPRTWGSIVAICSQKGYVQ